MSATPARQPQGQPTGGQFAAKSNPESGVELEEMAPRQPEMDVSDSQNGESVGATTSYGSWLNQTGTSLTVEQGVYESLGDFADDYDIDAIASDMRSAVNEALPDGVFLAGDELYGPWDGSYAEDTIKNAVLSVDFWAIADRHDISQPWRRRDSFLPLAIHEFAAL
jgi:hypothetical protein